ncbi:MULTISPECIES: hypothetical protein [Catenuloplanes]|uniref:Uncharacterized protein n=1 Tax=Catenuloplanes niger TaxID=587534 RepID=A0AAE3ZL10_9ACTN|nr:hypothetical protein [Catenuloplanes niger]MDR7320108.1 hypothetical protein [Catenuloplanes niger]
MTWNRLLLLAYPRGPRRAEVLDTLTMAAEAGRSGTGSLNLLRYGLRARLGHPRSRTVVVLSLLLAFAGGFLTASATHRLAWEAGPALPGAAEAAAISALVDPGLRLAAHGDGPFHYPPGEEISARELSAQMPGTPATRDVATYMSGLRQRLGAAGWEITGEGGLGGDSQYLVARHDGLVLHVGDNHRADADLLIAFVRPVEPAWISAVTVAGGLLGAALTWLLAGWASRRTDGRPGAAVPAGIAAWAGLLAFWPVVHGARDYLPEVFAGGYDPGYPFWAGLTQAGEYGIFAVLAGLLLGAAFAITLPPGRRAAPDPTAAAG